MKWDDHVARMGERREMHIMFWMENLQRRDHLEYNVGMHNKEIGWEGVDWLHLAQDRDQWRALLNTVTNLRVP
jgi:hypothetical protein